MDGSESTPEFNTISEIAKAAENMDDVDEMISFVEQENSKLNPPFLQEDLDKIIHAISKKIIERNYKFDSKRCLEELNRIVPDKDVGERVKQGLDFVKDYILSKNGDIIEQELFIEGKVFDYFGIPKSKQTAYGKIFRNGYEKIVKDKRKKQSKREINEMSNAEGITKTNEEIENEDSNTSTKIFRISPSDISEVLNIPLSGNIDLLEAEAYHIEALRLKNLQDYDIFGKTDYNTANFRSGNNGLFYYDPKRVYITEYEEDGTSKKIFDHWAFTEEELSPTPITVVDSARNVDSSYGEIFYTMQLRNEYGELNTFTEPKKSLFTKNGILSLISKNFCVTDTSSLRLWKIQEYFKTLFYNNADVIPKSLAAESTGWKNDGKYFVIGDRAYSDDGVLQIHMLDNYIEQVYKPKGTLENYFLGIKEVVETFPIAQFMIYASCASTILYLLGIDSVVVFLRGQSTTGKTKICKLAISPFTYLTKIADSTKSYQELDAALNDGLPIFYDEASGNEERLNNILYTLANGTGKGRGKPYGEGVTHGKTWKTVIFYNGENPILSESDNVGKFVRVIEIKNPIQKSSENKELMDRIEKTCSENHGLLADLFLKEVFRRKGDIPTLYEGNLRKFGKCNDAGERLKKYFAAFATAGEILAGIFADNQIETVPAFEVVNAFFKEVVLGRPIEDEYKRALRMIMNWVVSNEGAKVVNTTSIEKSEVKPSEIWAWITEPQTGELRASSSHRICFIPVKLYQLLEEHGFNPYKIIEAWAERGIIDAIRRIDKEGNPYGKPITELKKVIDGRHFTAIKIKYDNALEELGLMEHPELKMPEKTPLQKMKEAIKIHAENRFKMGIKETKETLLDSVMEMFPNTYSRKDIEFVIEGLCQAGELRVMPSA